MQTGSAIKAIDWASVEESLHIAPYASLGRLLSPAQIKKLIASYDDQSAFRSTITMASYNFGRGEYRYFAYPLPNIVAAMRRELYPPLARIANRWADRLETLCYPKTHKGLIAKCAAAGQIRPTPLILRYGEGDYNCLHQDLYGDVIFPLQIVILLSEPDKDFSGGEFVLAEQRPRMQSRAHVVPMRAGEAVVFAVNERPVEGRRGYYRAKVRHGVSQVRCGQRYALGVIFHDAA
ncbi:MAG: 2OG-Fe(II) oxygenase [Pseudomonadota bacterium]